MALTLKSPYISGDILADNETGLLVCPCVEGINVLTFCLKCNKVLNVITFSPKCNQVINS